MEVEEGVVDKGASGRWNFQRSGGDGGGRVVVEQLVWASEPPDLTLFVEGEHADAEREVGAQEGTINLRDDDKLHLRNLHSDELALSLIL